MKQYALYDELNARFNVSTGIFNNEEKARDMERAFNIAYPTNGPLPRFTVVQLQR